MRGLEGSPVDPSSHGGYLREIEALSKALNVESKSLRRHSRAAPPLCSRPDRESLMSDDKGGCAASRSLSTGKSPGQSDSDRKEKKPSSLWNWKPLKALSHIGHRRFDCIFSMYVQSIDNIPPALADASLCVHWRRSTVDSGSTHTRAAVVHHATAKFDETLTYNCSVYGSRSRAQGYAKYEARNFLIYAKVVGAPGLNLGKHQVDLTRLLPPNLQDLEEGKSSGKWNTTFRLSGKAIGASLSVSFGFSVVTGNEKVHKSDGDRKSLRDAGEKADRVNKVAQLGSLPRTKSHFVDNVKALWDSMEISLDVVPDSIASTVEGEVIGELDSSAETKCCVLREPCERNMQKSKEQEFLLIERGTEIAKEDNLNVSANRMLDSERQDVSGTEVIGREIKHKEDENSYFDHETGKLATLLRESSFPGISINEFEEMGYAEPKAEASEKLSFDDVELKDKAGMKSRPCSLDDLTDEIASEFLSMLDVEHSSIGLSSEGDPDSPREQLWKQFRRESLGHGGSMFGFDIEADEEISCFNSSDGFDFSSVVHDAVGENKKSSQALESKSMARVLEDAETEALLREWGLNEKFFERSPPGSRNGFGSPIDLPPEEPPELPPLGANLGPFVQTKDGGFLRTMSPNLFKDSKSNGYLIMQVSKPVVLPAEMGSDNPEILEHLASIGVEKLSMHANKLMPLEEITGGFIQQLAWHAVPDTDAFQRQISSVHQNQEDDSVSDPSFPRRNSKYISAATDGCGESNCDYVSLKDLAPLAMEKIETLSIEGLKIQSGMSDEEAPSNITKQYVGEMPSFEGKGVRSITSAGLEGVAGLQLLDVKDDGDDIDGLMGLSISLDEWMQLDMGIVEEYELSDRTSKILAAHHAKPAEFLSSCWKDDKRGKNSGRRWGLLESNFTVALMVQLRDPLRNYEPVGTPMLALVQVERVFLPPKPKIYYTVSDKSKFEQENESDTEIEQILKIEKENVTDVIPQFKVTEVHVAGLKTEPEKKRHWGNSIQQQSGSRWLLANGMGKLNKHPLMKSNTSNKVPQLTTKVQPEETLWSISSRVHDNGSKWKEVPAVKPHKRNPNFLFFR